MKLRNRAVDENAFGRLLPNMHTSSQGNAHTQPRDALETLAREACAGSMKPQVPSVVAGDEPNTEQIGALAYCTSWATGNMTEPKNGSHAGRGPLLKSEANEKTLLDSVR